MLILAALTQMILLTAGYLHRSNPMMLFTITKSSIQTHGTSNRLKASSQRAQWLGMVAAMALSDLTDKPGSRLTFEDDSMQTPEAKWYMSLPQLQDTMGNLEDLRVISNTQVTLTKPKLEAKSAAPSRSSIPSRLKAAQKGSVARPISRITEIEDDNDDDIIPYAKPDSDPEDEDDDPTLVERNKPRAPVYIRDLLGGLRETENYERYRLYLETASPLIRRKATFGKEVSDHAEELLGVLINLQDTFEMDDFMELRQEALISLLTAQPQIVAPRLTRLCFEGDFSIQQRAAMFTALALGARELAGFKDADQREAPDFPSKKLPEHLQQVYGAIKQPRLEAASQRLEEAMVQPMALTAADQISGPNALKVRTFSSRMEVEKKKKSKAIPNALAKNVAELFFMPLVAGWWAQQQSLYVAFYSYTKRLANAVCTTEGADQLRSPNICCHYTCGL